MAHSRTGGLLVCALAVAIPTSARGAQAQPPSASADPVARVRFFDRHLRSLLRHHFPSWSPEAEVAQLQVQDLVDQTLSVSELARETLGRHWAEATAEQQRAFLCLFRELLAKRIASGQLLDYEPETPPKLMVLADDIADVGMIVRPRESSAADPGTASVDYKLRYLSGRWQLVDLLVDDQSMVSEYRYQFDRIIARERFDGLLERMRRKAT